jgi:hypothetical protein
LGGDGGGGERGRIRRQFEENESVEFGEKGELRAVGP